MKRFNILLVDDEPALIDMVKFMLEADNYNIFVANSAEKALKVMDKEKIDLVLSDHRMPGMLGIDLLKRIKSKYPDTIRILMTGFKDTEIFISAINVGEVYKIVTKPLDLENMKIVVKRALEHYDSIQENKRLMKELEDKVISRTKELKQSEELYKVLVENAKDCIYLLDLKGRFIHINRGGVELNELSDPEGLIGDYFSKIVDNKYGKEVEGIIKKCKKGKFFLNYEYFSVTEKGNIKWWDLNLVPVRNEDKKIVNLLGVSRDITVRRKYEQQVARIDRLVSLGTLSAGIAHEIRNPLSFIKINLQSLRREHSDERLIKNIKDSLEGVRSIENIVESTLQFAKPAEPKFSKENINLIIKSVLLLMKLKFEKNNVVVESILDNNLPDLNIDPRQITQVLINLLNNAIQAISEDGKIVIMSYSKKYNHNKSVGIDVSDNGSGISEDKIKFIFDPFFTTKPKGTGLGLSIVQNILKEHNADIFIESKLNEGTKISVEFTLTGD